MLVLVQCLGVSRVMLNFSFVLIDIPCILQYSTALSQAELYPCLTAHSARPGSDQRFLTSRLSSQYVLGSPAVQGERVL